MAELKKIGCVGLGTMGGPVALNIAEKGAEEVWAYDVSPETRGKFSGSKLKMADSYKQFADIDIIFLCLPDTRIVELVLFGENGLFESLREGQLIVDLSTIKYKATLEIEKKLAAKKVSFLDAPISGMGSRAKEGTLSVMCGGDEKSFLEAKPYFDRIGTNVLYMGKCGNGQLTKLINQLLFDINLAGLAEIMPFAVKMGLDPDKVTSIVNTGTGRSFASEHFLPKILARNFSGGYPMASAYKDLVSASEVSASLNLPLPVLSAATATYQLALLKGYGGGDKGVMVKIFEELFGVEFRSGEQK